VAGSIHPKGGMYEWKVRPSDAPFAPPPGWLVELLAPPKLPEPPRQTSPRPACGCGHRHTPAAGVHVTAGSVLAAHKYMRAVPPAFEGHGGWKATNAAMMKLWGNFGHLAVEDLWEVAREWNATCYPPWKEGELRAKFDWAGGHAKPKTPPRPAETVAELRRQAAKCPRAYSIVVAREKEVKNAAGETTVETHLSVIDPRCKVWSCPACGALLKEEWVYNFNYRFTGDGPAWLAEFPADKLDTVTKAIRRAGGNYFWTRHPTRDGCLMIFANVAFAVKGVPVEEVTRGDARDRFAAAVRGYDGLSGKPCGHSRAWPLLQPEPGGSTYVCRVEGGLTDADADRLRQEHGIDFQDRWSAQDDPHNVLRFRVLRWRKAVLDCDLERATQDFLTALVTLNGRRFVRVTLKKNNTVRKTRTRPPADADSGPPREPVGASYGGDLDDI
jgi:hypothetical protein